MKAILKATASGLRRLLGSWRPLLLLWLVNLVVALPFAWAMAEALEDAIGPSLVHEGLRQGFDLGWFGELEAEAQGLETTFSPTVVGVGAFFSNFEGWLTGELFEGLPLLVGLGVAYALLWALLLGGLLRRMAEPAGRLDLADFLANGGRYFFRFLRLAVLAALLYYLVYRLQGWLFGSIPDWTRDVTSERTVLLYTLLASGLVVLLLNLVHMAFDYAKIATVLESRRSMLLAALRGFGFVFFYPGKSFGLYYLLAAVGLVLLALYAQLAPGSGQSTLAALLLAFLVGQAFLIGRLALRLVVLGSQMSLYQTLADAGE